MEGFQFCLQKPTQIRQQIQEPSEVSIHKKKSPAVNELPAKNEIKSQPIVRSNLSTNSDSNYSSDRTKSSDEEDGTIVKGKSSSFPSRKQTPDNNVRKEDVDIPLGADAGTLNHAENSVTESEEEEVVKRNNIDDASSFRAKPPSTAMSTCSTISTGQLIPSSGYNLLHRFFSYNILNLSSFHQN